MALQTINVGLVPNDGTGDDLRTAFSKINANFDELELQGGQANTIHNVGTGIGIYKEKIGVDLRLKSLVAGSGVTLTNNPNEILIDNNRNVLVRVNANTGSLIASTVDQAINIVGGTGISTAIVGNTLTITGSNYNIETDTSPKLGGDLDLNGFNIIGGSGSTISANLFDGNLTGNVNGNLTGNVTGLIYGIDVRDIQNQFLTFDFGPIYTEFTSPISWLLHVTGIDMGSIASPSSIGIDGGPFV